MAVRWDRLFDELEASAAEADRLDHRAEVADRTRRERARVQLSERALAAEQTTVELRVSGVGSVRGVVSRVGGQWMLLSVDDGARREVLVPLGVILAATGMGRRAVSRPPSAVASRLGLGHVLRGMSRDRSIVQVALVDGHLVTGVIDGVGADHLDLTSQVPGEPLAAGATASAVLVPFRAMATVSRAI